MNLVRGSKDDRAAPQVFLAAFGKHPGWDDHIEEIGVETEHLASIKQLLYVQGIGGTIDAGAWDDLSDPQRIGGFEHVFLCRTPGDLVLGRLWSSTDGKGRSRYPMVVCVQCTNLPLSWVLHQVLPALAEVENRCKEVTTAAEVVAITDQARRQLRDLAESADIGAPALVVSPRSVVELADRPEMLDGHEGLLRILYQMERETNDYARGNLAAAARDGSLRPVQMRVPACGDSPDEVISRWLEFFFTRLDQAAEVWAIYRLGRPWLDVVIGDPAPNQFFCFQASREALPLASEIPYTLDDDFRARADQFIDDARSGKMEQIVLAPAGATPRRLRQDAGEVSDAIASMGRSKTFRLALIVMAILILLTGLLVAVVTYWPPSPPQNAPPPSGKGMTGSTMAPADAKAWRDLCMESYAWFAPFLADANELRVTRWRNDPHLASTIVPVFRKVLDQELELDPKQIASVTGRHLKNLAEEPPASARTPDAIAKTARAVEALREIRQSISAEAWPALARLKELARTYRKRNWLLQADYLDAVASRADHITSPEPSDQVPDLPGRITEVLDAFDKTAELEDLWSQVQQQAKVLRDSGNVVLARFGDFVKMSARSAAGTGTFRDLSAMGGRLKDARSLGGPIVAYVQDNWREKVDLAIVDKDPLLSGPVSAEDLASGEVFPRWLASIRSEQFATLDPAADPRTKDHWASSRRQELTAITGKIVDLRKKYSSPEAEGLQKQLAILQTEQESLLALRWDREQKGRITREAAEFPAKVAGLARQCGQALARAAGGREAFVANIPPRISNMSAAINSYWSGRIAELVKIEDTARLTIKVEKLEEDLVELDDQLPSKLSAVAQDKDWNRLLAGSVTMGQREVVLKKALAAMEWKDDQIVRNAAFEETLKACRGDFEIWRKQIAKVLESFNAVEDAMILGAGLGEKPAGQNKTIAQIWMAWQAKPIWQISAVVEALRPVTERIALLEQIEKTGTPDKLLACTDAIATDRFEAARAVWERLGQLPGWPASPEQFNQERNLHRHLFTVYEQIQEKHPARGRQLVAELVDQTRLRWQTFFLALSDAAQIDVAVARMPQFFLDANQAAALSSATGFRLALRDLRHELLGAASPMEDQAVRKRIRAFVATVRKLPGIADAEPVSGLLAELSKLAEARDEGVDLTKAGPALAGWTPHASRDGSSVRFDWPGDSENRYGLEFLRVEPPGKPASYLCTTETPVGLLIKVAAQKKQRPNIRTLLRTSDSPELDKPVGPHTWEVGPGGDIVVATTSAKLPPGFSDEDFYYVGAKVPKPKATLPAQYVSPVGAIYFARMLGCRLPSSEEWAAAVALESALDAGVNLRDQTWQRQKAHLQKLEEGRRLSAPEDYYPDAGAFWPKAVAQRKVGRDAKSLPSDDGVLWFSPVGNAKAGTFHGLVGNVAEFTLEDPSVLAKWKGDDVDGLKQIMAKASGDIRVIGGSALSAPSIPVNKPQLVNYAEASAGYADVGFRLAFTAPAETIQVRIRRLLSAMGYPAVGRK